MSNTPEMERREVIAYMLDLELNHHGQWVPNNIDDYLADWTGCIDKVEQLIQAEKEKALRELVEEIKSKYQIDGANALSETPNAYLAEHIHITVSGCLASALGKGEDGPA